MDIKDDYNKKTNTGGAGGRKTKYKAGYHDVLGRWMARGGLTHEEIAEEFDITLATLYNWKKKHTEFFDALKEGKELVDSRVEGSLLQRAEGFYTEEVQTNINAQGNETHKIIKKYVVPDVTAQIFWLKNRRPQDWRDRKDHQLSGSVDQNITQTDKLITDFRQYLDQNNNDDNS